MSVCMCACTCVNFLYIFIYIYIFICVYIYKVWFIYLFKYFGNMFTSSLIYFLFQKWNQIPPRGWEWAASVTAQPVEELTFALRAPETVLEGFPAFSLAYLLVEETAVVMLWGDPSSSLGRSVWHGTETFWHKPCGWAILKRSLLMTATWAGFLGARRTSAEQSSAKWLPDWDHEVNNASRIAALDDSIHSNR